MEQQQITDVLNKASEILQKKYGKPVTVRITRDKNALLMFNIAFASYDGDKLLGSENVSQMFGLDPVTSILVNSKLINTFKEEAKIYNQKLSDFCINITFNPPAIKYLDNTVDLTKYL